MKVTSFSAKGTKHEAEVTLNKAVFGAELNPELVGLAYRAYLAAGRHAGAQTLTRGLVSGGGKKPWRQKGTGRARVGSSRVPEWKGGGVVFGPTGSENYNLKLSTKTKRAAIRQALSAQVGDKKLFVIDDIVSTDGKVKPMIELLAKLKLTGKILVVVNEKTPLLDRATRNIAGVALISAKYVNVYTVLNADAILVTKPALETIDGWLGEAK